MSSWKTLKWVSNPQAIQLATGCTAAGSVLQAGASGSLRTGLEQDGLFEDAIMVPATLRIGINSVRMINKTDCTFMSKIVSYPENMDTTFLLFRKLNISREQRQIFIALSGSSFWTAGAIIGLN
jgi:hypothetical protein